MRVLVVGVGAVGGYFGARLNESGIDVTFLVREKRKKNILDNGLHIKSIHGDITFHPKMILKSDQKEEYDVILLATKSYHLKNGIEDIRSFVGEKTVIIPMLNGINHLSILQDTFSEEKVLGGLCFIESSLNENGMIIQTSPTHEFVFGELSGNKTDRIMFINEYFSKTNAQIRQSDSILKDMWHKYMFITGLSGVTTLFGSSIGPIRESEYGRELIAGLFKEIGSIMRAAKAPIANGVEEKQIEKVYEIPYNMKSSMQRDMEKGYKIEVDHLQGYLLSLAKKYNIETSYLKIVYTNLKKYEQQKK
jgi:2-dehydropantoate 2-reductase